MFTKLFSSITDSTIWREPDNVRIVWITMLAKCDKHGIVYASVPGLADAARVSIENCQDALSRLGSPDEWSRSKEMEGRRIEEVEGGWVLVNHAKYKRIKDADERREYVREKVQIYRARKQVVNNVNNRKQCKPGKHIRSDQIRSESDKEDISVKKESNSPKRILTDLWCSRFKSILNAPYKFNGVVDGRGADELLKLGMSPDEIMSIAEKAWRSGGWWCSKHSKTIASFSSKFNQIRDEVGELKAEVKKQSLKDDPFWKE